MIRRYERLSLLVAALLLTPISSLLAAPPVRTDRLGDPLPDGAVVRLGSLRLSQPDSVSAVAFSPDGKRLATGSDGMVRLWDAETGREVRCLGRDLGDVTCLGFSPNGKLLAVGRLDGCVILFDTNSSEVIARLEQREREFVFSRFGRSHYLIRRLAFLPDGETLLMVRNGTIQSWRWADDQPPASVTILASDFALAADGKSLAIPGKLGIWLRDVPSGKPLGVFTVPWSTTKFQRSKDKYEMTFGPLVTSFRALSLSSDGKMLAGIDHLGGVWTWDVAAGTCGPRLPISESVSEIAVSPDGKTVAAACSADDIGDWDAATGDLRWRINGQRNIPIHDLALSRDGRRLATVGRDGRVRLWDTATGREIDFGRLPSGNLRHRLSPDGRILATFDLDKHGGSALYLTATADSTLIGNGPIAAPWPQDVAFTPDSKALLLLPRHPKDGGVVVIDPTTGKEVRRCKDRPSSAGWMLMAPDGKTLAVAGPKNKNVVLWDWTTGTERRRLEGRSGETLLCAAFSPDGKRLVSAEDNGAVRVWATATGRELRRLDGHGRGRVTALAFAPDGATVATAGDDGFIILWDVDKGEPSRRLHNEDHGEGALAFSPDGRLLAARSEENTFSVWEVGNGRLLSRTIGHEAGSRFVAFLPDGKRLLTAGNDGTGLVWELAELKTAKPPALATTGMDRLGDPLPPDAVARLGTVRWHLPSSDGNAVVLTPDGKVLIGLSFTGGMAALRAWDVLTGKELWRADSTGSVGERDIERMVLARGGQVLAVREHSSCVALRDPQTGEVLRRIRPHRNHSIYALALSRDGKRLATAALISGRDVSWSEIALFDIASGHELRRFTDYSGVVNHLVFSDDGRRLVSSSYPDPDLRRSQQDSPFDDEDGGVLIWDIATGKCVGSEFTHPGLTFSPDGRLTAYAEEETALRIDNLNGVRQCQIPGSWQTWAISPDGKRLATHSYERPLTVWDTASGKELRAFGRENGWPGEPAAFSAAGRLVATCYNGWVRLWDVDRGEQVRPFGGHRDSVSCLAYSPDGRTLLTGGDDRTLRLWKASNGEGLAIIPFRGAAVKAVAIAPDGKMIAGVGEDGSVRLFDRATGHELQRFTGPNGEGERSTPRRFVTFGAAGRTLIVCDPVGETVVWDIAAKKELHHEKPREQQSGVGLARDGTIAAVAESERVELLPRTMFRLFDPATGRELQSIPIGFLDEVATAVFSPDNKIVAVAVHESHYNRWSSLQGQVRLFEVATGREIAVLHSDRYFADIAFSPRGSGLATTLRTGQVALTLRDWTTGQERGSRHGQLDSGRAVAFAPDGHTVATASDDGTVVVWDVAALLPAKRRMASPIAAAPLDALWADLAAVDAAQGYRAIDRLSHHADQTVGLLRERLRPVASVDTARIAALIAALDDDDFTERQKARMELETLAERAAPSLCQTLAGKPSAEQKRHARELLGKLATDANAPERLGLLRVTALLERINTAAARTLLTEWSQGAPEARLTQEAKASLHRLTR